MCVAQYYGTIICRYFGRARASLSGSFLKIFLADSLEVLNSRKFQSLLADEKSRRFSIARFISLFEYLRGCSIGPTKSGLKYVLPSCRAIFGLGEIIEGEISGWRFYVAGIKILRDFELFLFL